MKNEYEEREEFLKKMKKLEKIKEGSSPLKNICKKTINIGNLSPSEYLKNKKIKEEKNEN